MSALDDIRAAIAAELRSVAGLEAYQWSPGQINPPAAIVAPEGIEYNADFDGGAIYRFPVQFLAALGDWESAQKELDGFVSHDSAAVAAINGTSDFEARVVGMESYVLTTWGLTEFLGAQLIVEVIV